MLKVSFWYAKFVSDTNCRNSFNHEIFKICKIYLFPVCMKSLWVFGQMEYDTVVIRKKSLLVPA